MSPLRAMADLVTLDPVRLGGVIDTVPFADRMRLIPDLFGQMDAVIGQAGFFFIGPQTALYGIRGDMMEVRIGVPLDVALPGFEMFEAPGTQAVHHQLRGGFDQLPGIYRDLDARITALGRARGTWARETYQRVARDAALNIVDVYIDVAEAVD